MGAHGDITQGMSESEKWIVKTVSSVPCGAPIVEMTPDRCRLVRRAAPSRAFWVAVWALYWAACLDCSCQAYISITLDAVPPNLIQKLDEL